MSRAAAAGVTPEQLQAQEQEAMLKKYEKYQEIKCDLVPQRRRLEQPPFKMLYQTIDDMGLRLNNTVVYVGNELYFVEQCVEIKGVFWMMLRNAAGGRFRVTLDHPALDMRSPEPQYIVLNGRTGFFGRRAFRQQQQGLHYNNMVFKEVGRSQFNRVDQNQFDLLGAFKLSTVLPWSPLYERLMTEAKAVKALRLSPHVAFYMWKDKLAAEYKGRAFGFVSGDTVTADTKDLEFGWIRDDFREIGCTLREGNLKEMIRANASVADEDAI